MTSVGMDTVIVSVFTDLINFSDAFYVFWILNIVMMTFFAHKFVWNYIANISCFFLMLNVRPKLKHCIILNDVFNIVSLALLVWCVKYLLNRSIQIVSHLFGTCNSCQTLVHAHENDVFSSLSARSWSRHAALQATPYLDHLRCNSHLNWIYLSRFKRVDLSKFLWAYPEYPWTCP